MNLDLRAMNVGSRDELEAVLALFERAFGRPMTKEFYQWRFLDNPFGPPFVTLLWDGPTLAGHYAASAMRGWHRGPVASAQSMTTMTHPNYRNRDVFTTLATNLYERMDRDFGVQMIWGYPNTKSHFGLVQRLGWRDIALLPTLTCDLETVDSKGTDVDAMDLLPAGLDDLFARSDDGRPFLSARDQRYLQWRYEQNPEIKYVYFGGSDVLLVGKTFQVAPGVKSLEVVDYLSGRRPNVIADLVAEVGSWAKARGYRFVRTWAPMTDPVYPFLEKLGFLPREPLTYFCVRPIAPDFGTRIEGGNWAVTMGDSDNY